MKKHHVNTFGERSSCGSPGHSDAIIKCTCGWDARLSHIQSVSKSVSDIILHHRLDVIEKEVGISFKRTFNDQKESR